MASAKSKSPPGKGAEKTTPETRAARTKRSAAKPQTSALPAAGTAPAAAATTAIEPKEGAARAVIDAVLPSVDGGRFPVKGIAGEAVKIEAHCFADGHDKLRVVLQWRSQHSSSATYEVDMQPQPNDVWLAEFTPPAPGRYTYTVSAWVDHFASWRAELERREELNDIRVALRVGSALIEHAASHGGDSDADILNEWAGHLLAAAEDPAAGGDVLKALALDPARAATLSRRAERRFAVARSFELIADRKRAAFSSWYELFPRSSGAIPGQHGTFADVEARLPYVAAMGFDVLYLPPIHPIGRTNRKGANNLLRAAADDVGSPWAIGAAEGGHKDILARLGDFAGFDRLLTAARSFGIEIALDIAFQCAPDHSYVSQHPQWFKHRPDGSVQYAENPPKKYQDIYPFDFETDDWRALWAELKSVIDFWIERGVKIFRVDNPHTKALGFWEWLIAATQRAHPDVIFLAEAFTRPKVMHHLAKLGFSQSYTYFTWRNSKQELTDYFIELSVGPGREYFRPNVWTNTPDILPASLQSGRRSAYAARLILAATLSANYGIYGPVFELMESTAREPGSEEYLDSEKYQLRHWRLDAPDSLSALIARINRIRRESPALQANGGLHFCGIDNDQLIAYVKIDEAAADAVLTVVNLDAQHTQTGWLELDLEALHIDAARPYQAHDLLSGQRYLWQGRRNFISLDPQRIPAHIFKLRRRIRRENDFDYYQ